MLLRNKAISIFVYPPFPPGRKASMVNDREDPNQIALAKWPVEKKICSIDSFVSPYICQIFSIWTLRLTRFSPIAKFPYKVHHKKFLTFGLNGKLHNFFHVESEILKEVEAVLALFI